MYRLENLFYFGILCFALTACEGQPQNKQQTSSAVDTTQFTTNIKHCVYSDDSSKLCQCPAEYQLKDSLKLTHIKDQFYRSKTGHLYEKTIATKRVQGQDTLVDVTYFNGYFSQEVDPITFEPFDGWYAKDKNYVYYYRPVSGGMQISKIDTADPKTFKLLAGHYKYAMDKNFFYDEPEIIDGFIPGKTNQKLDNKGRVIEMTCNNKTYKFEIVN
jgi:hypothetical protein